MDTPYKINVSTEEREWYVKRFMETLIQKFGEYLTSVVLYGSTARGTARPDSDIDLLLVIKNLPKGQLERSRQLLPLCDGTNKKFEERFDKFPPHLSLIEKSDEEAVYHSPLYLDMLEDGKILYDRDDFISKIFDDMRIRLKELGARRIWIGTKWYWELKPDYKFGEEFEV